MAQSPQADPEFGELISQRGVSRLMWIIPLIMVLFSLIGLAMCYGGVRTRFFPSKMLGPNPGTGSDWMWLVLVGAGFVVVFGGLAMYSVRRLRTKHRFYELGVRAVYRGQALRSMAYRDCERLTYAMTRQYINGIYAGTSVTVSLKAKGRPTVRWSGAHKEQPQGLSFTILGRGEFKGEDELDVVKLVIADAMADNWMNRMSSGMSVDWCGQIRLNEMDLTILKGWRKGQTMPYANIDRFSADKGVMHFFTKGDNKPTVKMSVNETNFWPGMRVMERMWLLAGDDPQTSRDAGGSAAGDAEIDS